MATFSELQAAFDTIKTLNDSRNAAAESNHLAQQKVADVTAEQNGMVIDAQNTAATTIGSAQTDADKAKSASDDAEKALDDAIDAFEVSLTAAKA